MSAPTDQGMFKASTFTEDHPYEAQKAAHDEKVEAFYETNLVEKPVLNQILHAYDKNVPS